MDFPWEFLRDLSRECFQDISRDYFRVLLEGSPSGIPSLIPSGIYHGIPSKLSPGSLLWSLPVFFFWNSSRMITGIPSGNLTEIASYFIQNSIPGLLHGFLQEFFPGFYYWVFLGLSLHGFFLKFPTRLLQKIFQDSIRDSLRDISLDFFSLISPRLPSWNASEIVPKIILLSPPGIVPLILSGFLFGKNGNTHSYSDTLICFSLSLEAFKNSVWRSFTM